MSVTDCVTGNAIGTRPAALSPGVPTEVPVQVRTARARSRAATLTRRAAFPEMPAAAEAPEKSVTPERSAVLRSMPYEEYLLTPEWDARRMHKILSAGKKCQVCNSGSPLNVHHRTYIRRGVERWSDLIVLCVECHELFHAHRRLADGGEGA